MAGSLVFVHGTGVRLAGYEESLKTVGEQMRLAGIDRALVECDWGDPLGGMFEGNSLPDPPDEQASAERAQELARWTWLFDDPLAELEMLSIRAASGTVRSLPGKRPEWRLRLDAIKTYKPGDEMQLLLKRSGLDDLWGDAFGRVVSTPIVDQAFQRSEEANELADAGVALTRAVVARLHADALDRGRPLPSATIRALLTERLCKDWDCAVFALGSLLAGFAKRIGTKVMRRRRNAFNGSIAGFVGDILLYQSHGQDIRDFIERKVAEAVQPVTIIGHSLGGIACVDLLALRQLDKVDRLVTVGSQAPYFYEVDALYAVRQPAGLPDHFPPWLNIFDRNDFLSFVGARLFPGKVTDEEAPSGAPFPEAHSAYLANDAVWNRVREFIAG